MKIGHCKFPSFAQNEEISGEKSQNPWKLGNLQCPIFINRNHRWSKLDYEQGTQRNLITEGLCCGGIVDVSIIETPVLSLIVHWEF